MTPDLYVVAWVSDEGGHDLAIVALNRGGAVSEFRIDTTTASLLGPVSAFDPVAGTGAMALDGARLRLTIEAGGAAIFRGR